MTGRKIRKLWTDRAFDSHAWEEYCQEHNILHEFTAPYSSAQNGLAERAIRTTMDDVCTLLRDAGLGHSFWAEAAAYSADTRNVVPSRRHPGQIPLEAFVRGTPYASDARLSSASASDSRLPSAPAPATSSPFRL